MKALTSNSGVNS